LIAAMSGNIGVGVQGKPCTLAQRVPLRVEPSPS
jgi:hypothetical protein